MYPAFTYAEKALTDIKVDDLPEIRYLSRRRIIANTIMDRERAYPVINDIQRADWNRNHLKIKNVIREFIRQGGRFSNQEIAAATGLSECTVKKHVKSIDIGNLYYRERLKEDKATKTTLSKIARASKAGVWKATELALFIYSGLDRKFNEPYNSRWEKWEVESLAMYYKRRVEEELIDLDLDLWGYPSESQIKGRPTFERALIVTKDQRTRITDRFNRRRNHEDCQCFR